MPDQPDPMAGVFRFAWEQPEAPPAEDHDPGLTERASEARERNATRREREQSKHDAEQRKAGAAILEIENEKKRGRAHAERVADAALRGDSPTDLAEIADDLAELVDDENARATANEASIETEVLGLDDDADDDNAQLEGEEGDDDSDSADSNSDAEDKPKKKITAKEALKELSDAGVDIDGVTITNQHGAEITLREAIDNGMMQAQFTRKTQELSQERKHFETERQSVREIQEAHATGLEQIGGYLEAIAGHLPPEVRDVAAQVYNQVQEQRTAIQQQRQRELVAAQETWNRQNLEAQHSLLTEQVPEWKDKDAFKAGTHEVMSYLRDLGATDADLHVVGQSAAGVVLARKAMLYDRSQKRLKDMPKPKPRQSNTALLKPGTTISSNPKSKSRRGYQAARDRAAQTGSVQDVADMLIAGGLVD